MKTTTIAIAIKSILMIIAFLGIQTSTLVASNIGEKVIPTAPTTFFCPECPLLFPKVPLEAPFSELTEFENTTELTPEVPMEATFDDAVDTDTKLKTNDLAPVLPAQADFDDLF